jgi:hypothetical protein
MFLHANLRNEDRTDHTYWSLVETVRTPDGPRQKTGGAKIPAPPTRKSACQNIFSSIANVGVDSAVA